jgi:hypothetical protein
MKRYVTCLIIMVLLGLGATVHGQLSPDRIVNSPCPLAFDTNLSGSSVGGSASSLSSGAPNTGPNPYTPATLYQPIPGTGFPSGTPLQFSPGGVRGTTSASPPGGGISGLNPGSSISPGVTGGIAGTTFGVTC